MKVTRRSTHLPFLNINQVDDAEGLVLNPAEGGTAYSSFGHAGKLRIYTNIGGQATGAQWGTRDDRAYFIGYNFDRTSTGSVPEYSDEPLLGIRWETFWLQELTAWDGSAITISSIGGTGNTTVTMTAAVFTQSMVGSLIKVTNVADPGGFYRIVSVTSPTVAVVASSMLGRTGTCKIWTPSCENHHVFQRDSVSAVNRYFSHQMYRNMDYITSGIQADRFTFADTSVAGPDGGQIYLDFRSARHNSLPLVKGTIASKGSYASSKTPVVVNEANLHAGLVNKYLRVYDAGTSAWKLFQIATVTDSTHMEVWTDATSWLSTNQKYEITGLGTMYVNYSSIYLTNGYYIYGYKTDGNTAQLIGMDAGNDCRLGQTSINNVYINPPYLSSDSAALTIRCTGATGLTICDTTARKLAFWAKTPIAQPANANQGAFTDNTGGSASGTLTLAAITAGAGYTQADMTAVKNAIATIAAAHNQIRLDLVNLGLVKGSA